MPTRRRDPVSAPRTIPSSYLRHDYGIDDSITRMGYLSNAVIEDTFDAAARSRGKDHDLLRSANSAIHTPPGYRTGRRSQRFLSVPPDRNTRSTSPSTFTSSTSPSIHPKALVPYTNAHVQKTRMALTPSPSSLLSSRIGAFLRGSSVPPTGSSSTVGYKSFLDSANPLPISTRDRASSIVAYKSYLSDPSVTSPFSTRSSSRRYKGYEPPISHSPLSSQTYRSSSLPRYHISLDVDGEEDEDDSNGDGEGYQVGDYRRKYMVTRDRNIGDTRRPNALYYRTSSPEGSDAEEEDYIPASGTYSLPRPSGVSSLNLSSYDAPHDGSYEADMADMHDYVPFGPSRQGILELTQHDDYDDDDDTDVQSSYSSPLSIHPSIPLTSYSPSSLTRSKAPSVSLIPYTSTPSSGELTAPSSFAHTPVFETILANTAARARDALRGSDIPYKDASLVLSLEGSALSDDGKSRYGFRYYPPPIPLKGSGAGLDERLLGIVPQRASPADSFLGGYLDRLRSLHSDIEHRADSAEDRVRSRSVVPRPLPSLPNYSHQTIHMPVHIAGRAQSVPVSSYRSPLLDGRSHRVDVFPLVEAQMNLPRDALRLPMYKVGSGDDPSGRLSVLDKINIKVSTELHASPRASVVSRKARASSVPPVSGQARVGGGGARPGYPKVARAQPSVVLVSAPSYTNVPARTASTSKPVVLSDREAPWFLKARAGSVPPAGVRVVRAGSVPPRPRSVVAMESYEPVGTEGMKAHNPRLIRSLRAQSVGPRAVGKENAAPVRAATLGRYHGTRQGPGALPRGLANDIDNRLTRLVRSVSEARGLDSGYHNVPDVQQRALSRYLYAPRARYGPDTMPRRASLADFPLVYVPKSGPGPSNRAKAAIIGSKMEADDAGKKKKRPRSTYAATKYRETRPEPSEEAIYHNDLHRGALQSSRPPLPKLTDRKAIRDVDGFTRPKNVMSWQPRVIRTPTPKFTSPALRRGRFYRYPRPLPPAIYVPPVKLSLPKKRPLPPVNIRPMEPLRLPPKLNLDSNASGGPSRSSVKIPAYYAAGGDPNNMPVSDLRRRIRRTIAKAKNNADYYRE